MFLPLPSFSLPLPSCVPGYAYDTCNSDLPYTALRFRLPTHYIGPPKCFVRFLPPFSVKTLHQKAPTILPLDFAFQFTSTSTSGPT